MTSQRATFHVVRFKRGKGDAILESDHALLWRAVAAEERLNRTHPEHIFAVLDDDRNRLYFTVERARELDVLAGRLKK